MDFIKHSINRYRRELFITVIFILLATASLALGRLSVHASETVRIIQSPASSRDAPVVGSVSGSKYYFPWCGTVRTITEDRRVWFASAAVAQAAGYSAALNCKGLQ